MKELNSISAHLEDLKERYETILKLDNSYDDDKEGLEQLNQQLTETEQLFGFHKQM